MDTLAADQLARLLGVWQQGDGPLWLRLATRIGALVDDRSVPGGTRLPTERALAAALGVSRSTATAAYRHARDAGRLDSRQGAGTWTRDSSRGAPDPVTGPGTAFDTLGRSVAGVIDLSLAETRCADLTRELLADPAVLRRTVSTVAGTGYHPQGLPELRGAIASRLTGVRAGVGPLTADDVLVTTGAQQAIALAGSALAAPGATVLVEEATYPGALEAFRRAGLRVLPVPTDARGADPAALAELIARTRPALFYLVPVGSNPTGAVVPGERLDRLAEVLARTGVTVLEDRTAAPLADPTRVPAPLSARLPAGGAVTIGSMSKVAWAGLRTGWAVAARPVLRELLAARLAADLAGSLVSQSLALAVLPHLDRLAAAVRAELRTNREALGAALAADLPQWSMAEPQAGAWVWARVPGDARALARAAAAEGVLVTPGPAFSPQSALTDRVRIAAVAPPGDLVEGVHRLRRAWTSLTRADVPPSPGDGRDLLLI